MKRTDLLRALLAPVFLYSAALGAAETYANPAGLSGPELAAVIQDAGYRAVLGVDGEGDPQVTTRMSGVTVYVSTYDCTDGRCESLQLGIGLDLAKGSTAAVANEFNRSYRYGRVYLDQEGDPHLAFDFKLPPADRAAFIEVQLEIWEDVLGSFLRDTGWRVDGAADAAPEA